MMKKHRITITLDWASLNKDVQDKAYRMARLAKLGAEDEAAADRLESELTLTDDDMSLLRRAMTQGLAEVVTMCREYVWNKSHAADNHIIKEDNLTITLMMPVNFNLAGCESIGHAIHAYVVGKAMLEWFRYTVPARAAEQRDICAAARKEIETIINARVRATRGGQSIEVIVGDSTDVKVEMLYYVAIEDTILSIDDIQADGVKTTYKKSLSFTADEESRLSVAVALPEGYTPKIGEDNVSRLGNTTHNGQAYVWWSAAAMQNSDFTVSYS